MLEFRDVEIKDREIVCDILRRYECKTLEYNFTTLFIWQSVYNIKIAEENGILFVSSGADKPSFLFPAADDEEKALAILEKHCAETETAMNFHSLTPEQADMLRQLHPKRYRFAEDRDSGDYIYTAEALSELKGKKLSAKRNHINRFVMGNPDWRYEFITPENINDAADMHREWCRLSESADNSGLAEEGEAVRRALKYFWQLKLSGGILYTGRKAVAFSIGDELNKNTFLVHVEKAFADIQGAYPMINKQFVINNCNGYEFVDREDDAGDEGLRRAKLSYQPYEVVEKFIAREG